MTIYNYIKKRLSISKVISKYTSIEMSGDYFKGICPICDDKKDSLTVSIPKQIFYCFNCHTGGDSITFVSRMEKLSQEDAARFIVTSEGLYDTGYFDNMEKGFSDMLKRIEALEEKVYAKRDIDQ